MPEADPPSTNARPALRGTLSVPAAVAALIVSTGIAGLGVPQAAARSREDDAPLLILKPATPQSNLLAHGSHASHRSHASHASHYSSSPGSSPRPSLPSLPIVVPTPAPAPAPRTPAAEPSAIQPVTPQASESLLDVLARTGKCDLFVACLRKNNGLASLAKSGQVTIFAPSDAALRKLPSELRDQLLDTKDGTALDRFVRSHAVTGTRSSAQLKAVTSLSTIGGTKVTVNARDAKLVVNTATLEQPDLSGAEGVAHVVDAVLSLSEQNVMRTLSLSGYPTMAKLIDQSSYQGMARGEWPITVFAPTEKAFEALSPAFVKRLSDPANRKQLDAFVERHIVLGRVFSTEMNSRAPLTALDHHDLRVTSEAGTISLDNAKLSRPDLPCSNGVVHGMDAALAGEK